MAKYKTKFIKSRKRPDSVQNVFQITRTDKQATISVQDIRNFVSTMETKAKNKKKNVKIALRALNPEKYHTLKGFSTDLQIQDFDDYLKNKVKDTSKFEFFSQLEITVLTET